MPGPERRSVKFLLRSDGMVTLCLCRTTLSALQPAISFATHSTTRSDTAARGRRAVVRAMPWRGSRLTPWSTTSNGQGS